VRVALAIDPDPKVREHACDTCGEPFQRVTGFIHNDGDAYAVYFASCYHHGGHEAYIDVVFSKTWDDGSDDRETFGCRVGPVAGQSDPACSLVTGGSAFRDSALFGRKLTREQARAHPRLPEFWAVVDHILVNDRVVRDHVYGPGAVLSADDQPV
jgi:hypothetical protein